MPSHIAQAGVLKVRFLSGDQNMCSAGHLGTGAVANLRFGHMDREGEEGLRDCLDH